MRSTSSSGGRRSDRVSTPSRVTVTKVGIVGAGLMATQLAALFVRRLELPLVIADVDEQALERARGAIEAELAGLVAKGRYEEGKARFLASLVHTTTGRAEFAGCELVLEAVFEQLELKHTVFAELEAVVAPSCVLATNTSALSVSAIAAGLEHPERVVGMHFFNPVGLLPLVEIVRGEWTDDATVATAFELTAKLRKRPLLVQDAPAFVVNRILTRLLRWCSLRSSAVIRSKRPTRRSSASACRWRRPCCCSWSARASRSTCSRRCTMPIPTASRCRKPWRTTPRAATRFPSSTRARLAGRDPRDGAGRDRR